MTNPDEVEDKFYDNLDSVIYATPLQCTSGHRPPNLGRSDGSKEVGKCNRNGFVLLRECAEHEILISNTVVSLLTRNKTSWMHPRSKHWHLIDYVIVLRKDRHDVRVTKTVYGAQC